VCNSSNVNINKQLKYRYLTNKKLISCELKQQISTDSWSRKGLWPILYCCRPRKCAERYNFSNRTINGNKTRHKEIWIAHPSRPANLRSNYRNSRVFILQLVLTKSSAPSKKVQMSIIPMIIKILWSKAKLLNNQYHQRMTKRSNYASSIVTTRIHRNRL
jgi:hypothetical protein